MEGGYRLEQGAPSSQATQASESSKVQAMQRSSASVSQQQLNTAQKTPKSELEQCHNSEQHKHQHDTACKRHAPPLRNLNQAVPMRERI